MQAQDVVLFAQLVNFRVRHADVAQSNVVIIIEQRKVRAISVAQSRPITASNTAGATSYSGLQSLMVTESKIAMRNHRSAQAEYIVCAVCSCHTLPIRSCPCGVLT